jgi:hypothetical protein
VTKESQQAGNTAPEKQDGRKKNGGARKNCGRKHKDFDQKIFENLCKLQCSVNEIEQVLGSNQGVIDKWCKRTYERSFIEVREGFRDQGKSSLRRAQFRLAERSAAMAIWLGKQYLDQKDVIHQNIESKGEITQKTILELPDNGRRTVENDK